MAFIPGVTAYQPRVTDPKLMITKAPAAVPVT